MDPSDSKKLPESSKKNAEEAEDDDEETKLLKRTLKMREQQDELMKRGEAKDFWRRLFMERAEAEQEEKLIRAQDARERKIFEAEQRQKEEQELLRKQDQEILEQKRRQLLRNTSIELRRFESEIRAANARKSARLQLLERQICKENLKIQEKEDDRLIQAYYQDTRPVDEGRKRDEYRRDLQEQLLSNDRLRQQKTEDTRIERKLVEEAIEAIRAENLENQRRKRENAARLLAEHKDFLQARQLSKFMEKQILIKENEDCARISADKIIEREHSDEHKIAALAAKDAIVERMTKNMLEKERSKRERQDIINELLNEEQATELQNRTINAAIEKNRIAKELLDDMMRQKLLIEERKANEIEIERSFGEYLKKERDKSIIADNRKAEERRKRDIEYRVHLKETIAKKNLRYAKAILENQTVQRERQLNEARRMLFIQDECTRMLEENAPRL